MQLAFQKWGSPSPENKRFVFLHGMGGTGALWRPVAAALEDSYEVMALDQRGHGGSRPASEGFTPIDYAKDVVETLQHENFFPAWLVGHSMGVRTAVGTHHLAPQLVRGLVLVDLGFYGQAGGGLGENLYRFLKILPDEFATREEARSTLASQAPERSIGQYLLAVSQTDPATGVTTFPFDRSALLKTIESVRDFSLREWIEEAGSRGTPVVALRGEKSPVWTAREFEEERQRFARYPSIRLIEMAGTGHGLPFEKRKEFVDLLKSLA